MCYLSVSSLFSGLFRRSPYMTARFANKKRRGHETLSFEFSWGAPSTGRSLPCPLRSFEPNARTGILCLARHSIGSEWEILSGEGERKFQV
jgi:hypothetical protein